MHAQGSQIKFLQELVNSLPPTLSLSCSWLKTHVGFQKNELADALAKWAAFFLPPPVMPPLPMGPGMKPPPNGG